jgi:hypothetical protein
MMIEIVGPSLNEEPSLNPGSRERKREGTAF